MTVDICIATYRRPGLLGNLLASILAQRALAVVGRVIVVDNDVNGSAGDVVRGFGPRFGAGVLTYAIEPERGIAQARNRALHLASADYVAFIDDDETAAPDWLAHLVATATACRADVVFGAVHSTLPRHTPRWIVDGRFFEHRTHVTGTRLAVGATNNVLIRRAFLASVGRTFDPSFGLTGGEDTELFDHLGRAGAVMVHCREAEVYDPVPRDRVTFRWLARRNFRSGQTLFRVVDRRRPAAVRWAGCAGRAGIALAALALAPLAMVRGPAAAALFVLMSVRNIGRVTAAFGLSFEEYRR